MEYIHRLNHPHIVMNPKDAEAIVLMDEFNHDPNISIDDLKPVIIDHKPLVICTNPDNIVRGKENNPHPVLGTYARKLEHDTKHPFIYTGKPFSYFSTLVKNWLTYHEKQVSKNACFFDDNPENINQLASDLEIFGCLITGTGISQFLTHIPKRKIDFELDCLTL